MISIIVATKNRPEKLRQFLKSLSTKAKFELILIDQGDSQITKQILKQFPKVKIVYKFHPGGGKAEAINANIGKARGDIFAFTDDDCVVAKSWLGRIEKYFEKHPKIDGVFGKTMPYKPKRHKGLICNTVFMNRKAFKTTDPHITFYRDLGIGNNMSYRREVFEKTGKFQKWLGVGSVSRAGGIEGEFIYRALRNNFVLAYDPDIIVHHDKWLTWEEEEILQTKYLVGTAAFYFYHLLRSRDLYLLVNIVGLRFHFTDKIREIIRAAFHLSFPSKLIYYLFVDLKSLFSGIYLGVSQVFKN